MRISDWSADVCSSDLMDKYDRARARRNAAASAFDREETAVGLYVSQNGYCARAHDGKRSRERRHRCGDDLITISNFERAQDQFDRIHAVPNADAMRCAARLCPAFFESLYFLTQNIPAGSENARGGIRSEEHTSEIQSLMR